MNIVKFGSYTLPLNKAEYDFSYETLPGATPILGGAGYFDTWGDEGISRIRPIVTRFTVYDDDLDGVDGLLTAARAGLLGVGRQVLSVALGNSTSTVDRQAYARCLKFEQPVKYNPPKLVDCVAEFEILQSNWDAVAASSQAKSGSPFAVSNAGNAYVERTLVITINGALSSSITITNSTNGYSFTYDAASDNIAGGNYIEIDCGALTVRDQAGTDKYEFFGIGSNQIGFMRLDAGSNTFTSSVPATNIDFDFRAAYW